MSYKELVLSSDPLAAWPLDDDVISGTAADYGKYILDGNYLGNISENYMPLVSGINKSVLLNDDTAKIIYPNIGATQIAGIWINGILWSAGKEATDFSVELFFRLDTADNLIADRINIFSPEVPTLVYVDTDYDDILDTYMTYDEFIAAFPNYTEIAYEVSYEPFGGLYAEGDKLIFSLDSNSEYQVEYPISDWSKRYHIILNYTPQFIEMIINGSVSVKKFYSEITGSDFEFLNNIGNFSTTTTNNYPLSVSMVAIDSKRFSLDRAEKRYYSALETVNYEEYFNSREKVVYIPSNRETIPMFSFSNPWSLMQTNNLIQSNNSITLPVIYDQEFVTNEPTFNTISGINGLLINQGEFLNLSSMFRKYGSKPFIFGMSFAIKATMEDNSHLFDLGNSSQGTYISAYVDDTKKLYVDLNGFVVDDIPALSTGWHDLVLVFENFDVSLYIDGVLSKKEYLPLTSYQSAIIGSNASISNFFNSTISWIRFSEDLENTYDYLNYDVTADKILKLNNNLKWYSKGSGTYSFFIDPSLETDGSLAYYSGKLNGVTVTYNDNVTWPQIGGLQEITSSGITESFYTITVELETEDSQSDKPYLSHLGLTVYGPESKRITASIESSQMIMSNKDDIILQQATPIIINRNNTCGATLLNGSYLKIPSIQDNTNTDLEEGTMSMNLFINPKLLSSPGYIFETDATSSAYLRWTGTEFEHDGLESIYYNAKSNYNINVIDQDWIWITVVFEEILPSANYIYLGSDNEGDNPIEMIVGLVALSSYPQTENDIENEFEALTGYAKEELSTDSASLNLNDSGEGLGLIAYNYAWQVA